MANQRLRLLAFVVPSLFAGLVAASGILVLLAYFFAHSAAPRPAWLDHLAAVLAVYAGSGLLAILGICLVAKIILSALQDAAAGRTARSLLVALPVGGIIAALSGVAVSASRGYSEQPGTLASIAATVLVVVVLTITAARWFAVRSAPHGT